MPTEKKRFSVPWYVVLIIILGVILGGGAVFNQFALKSDEIEHPAPGKIPENGGGAHFYTSGQRMNTEQPAVLLLGGWGTASPVLDYMPLIDRLSDTVQIITVERPGYGWAKNSFSERTLDNMVEEMRAGLEELNLAAPFVIVAHTTSGLEAIHYAKLYPNEVAGIVFLNSLSPGGYFYQADKLLDYLKALTYPVPKYTGIFRIISLFKPELLATGPEVDAKKYAAAYSKNIMSKAMFAELRMMSKNAKTAIKDGYVEVPSVTFVDSKAYNDSNPELVRVWSDYYGNVIETEVGSYIHGFEPDTVTDEILSLVETGEANYRDYLIRKEAEEAEAAAEAEAVEGSEDVSSDFPVTLDKGMVFRVNWLTANIQEMVGTSCAVQLQGYDEPILITASHYFNDFGDDVDLTNLSNTVLGGDITDVLDDSLLGKIRANIPIANAASIVGTVDATNDLAAFNIDVLGEIKPFTLAEGTCQADDVVYLLAEVFENDQYVTGIYPCTVIEDDGGTLVYTLPEGIDLNGTSGAPVVNSAGEIVGLQMGTNGIVVIACSASSIRSNLEAAIQAMP